VLDITADCDGNHREVAFWMAAVQPLSFSGLSKITALCDRHHGVAAFDSAKMSVVEGGDLMQDERDLLEELKFLGDAGYGRSPRTSWRATHTFQDLPTCLNFNNPARRHPCGECLLIRFVPEERKNENVPCWYIPLSPKGDTIDYYSRYGTPLELEEALAGWLRRTIRTIENERVGRLGGSLEGEDVELCRLAGT
jgi:hypothetical protein